MYIVHCAFVVISVHNPFLVIEICSVLVTLILMFEDIGECFVYFSRVICNIFIFLIFLDREMIIL
jgi:hypothetical protein